MDSGVGEGVGVGVAVGLAVGVAVGAGVGVAVGLAVGVAVGAGVGVVFLPVSTTLILTVAFFLLPSFALAVMVTVPGDTALTTPLEDTLATAGLLLFQVTLLLAPLGVTSIFRVAFFSWKDPASSARW